MTKDKRWLIVSWRHNDFMDGAYGQLIDTVVGSYDDACTVARQYIHNCSPVGVVGEITIDTARPNTKQETGR